MGEWPITRLKPALNVRNGHIHHCSVHPGRYTTVRYTLGGTPTEVHPASIHPMVHPASIHPMVHPGIGHPEVHPGIGHPEVHPGIYTTYPPWYTRVYTPPTHHGILHPPRYTPVYATPSRQRVYIPVHMLVADDEALGSGLRIIRRMRRIEALRTLRV